jgi:two-component system KDP operon response regulator KdpE
MKAGSTSRILLIEDDPAIRRFIRAGLSSHAYAVHETASAHEGMVAFRQKRPDLVLLDLGLPDQDGFSVIRCVRSDSNVPILVVSATLDEASKIRALDAGADDYLTKPFSFGELDARIRVALRHVRMRQPLAQNGAFSQGDLKVDMDARTVSLSGQSIHLTPIQYRLLTVLIEHSDRVLTHQQLLREVWGEGHAQNAHYLRIFMSQLRGKLEGKASSHRWIHTEIGVGYRFCTQPERS